MDAVWVVYGILAFPGVASLISLSKQWKLGAASTLFASFISLILSLYLFFQGNFSTSWFYVDFVSRAMLLVISTTFIMGSFHAYFCMDKMKEFFLKPNYYWLLLNLFALTMYLAVTTPSLGYGWMWLEASTVVSAALIIVERGKSHIESAWRYIIIASTGLGMALLAIIIYGRVSGNLLWIHQSELATGALLVGVLGLLGFGTKVGLFPMHTWLPDAHGTAPSPVSAMLSGALLPSALIVFYRLYGIVWSETLFTITLVFGILTVIVAGTMIISQKKFKRLLAYSSMDVMGIATVGIALTYYSSYAIIYVLIVFGIHALAKSSLFLMAGTLKRRGLEDVDKIRSLIRKSPAMAFTAVVSALTVTGAPPFGMFIGEIGILSVLAKIPHLSWLAFSFLLLGILLSFLGLNYWILKMVFPEEDEDLSLNLKAKDVSVPLLGSFFMLGLTVLIYSWLIWGWSL